MDTTLITVTMLSMAMAILLSVVVWRLLRDERTRGDARVAALQTLARGRADGDLPLRPPSPDHQEAAALFVERPHASPWPRRLGVMACLALTGAAAIFISQTVRNRAQAAVAGQIRSAASPAHLDLLSLRDTRVPGTLTVTGLVHNPRDGILVTGATVAVYAFDDKGAFLASGHARLDVTRLSPGDDSPFVVAIPAGDNAVRYRITFRGEDGTVIAHVDRRQQTAVAANW